ncbi:AMP-binding protein [Flavobacterium capsici]|uniref:AMP-binding protein n=1 Tax=Flavobacterium capsici TaxID=3075618 RepID=A0AA96J8F1_9FLAO|nr:MULTISPECIES: AMP-binding protein [unclassified Flavobacterium]WNM18285.1 AMP-binding protein [Flavobacterium sp. PMR2A8]WNM22336.1 AMP-binding protein [Flavobacterium sp. PMTSA4]
MSNPTYENVHNQFKLNGFHLDRDDLCRVAYSFIKEGEDFEKPVGDFLLDWFDGKDYIEMQTSGTTGIPKVVRISKNAMVNSALATGDFFELEPGNRALHCLPVKYVAGKMMLVRAMILGLDLEFVAPSSNPLENVDGNFDFVAMVPLQAQHSIKELKRVKKAIVGGAKISNSLEKQLLKLKTEVYETFGMTETITHIAAKRIGEKAFTVLPNVTISYDEDKCLVIHAPSISDDIIHTNDIVELVNENQFVFVGRKDNVINSGGIKLIPELIEEKLAGKIEQNYFITSKEDKELGQKVVLVIEGEKHPVDDAVFESLDKYEKPKEILFVKKFKETPSGKVIRKETLNANE